MVGLDVNPVVSAVSVSPKTVLPVMVTIPVKVAFSVVKLEVGPGSEGKSVGVSAFRA